MVKINSWLINLYLILNPLILILNAKQINTDSLSILSMAIGIYDLNFFPYYPQFYPLFVANYLIIDNFNILYFGILMGVLVQYLISQVIKNKFSKIESQLFIIIFNSYAYYSFALWYFIATPFQIFILYFFLMLIIFYNFKSIKKNFKIKFYSLVFIFIFWGCLISIQMLPTLLIFLIFILFQDKIINFLDLIILTLLIIVTFILSFFLILFNHPNSNMPKSWLAKQYLNDYIFQHSGGYFDFFI